MSHDLLLLPNRSGLSDGVHPLLTAKSELCIDNILRESRHITVRCTQEMFDCLPSGETPEEAKIFTIAYGNNADEALLGEIAHRTNGRFYTSDPENISDVYLQISFEQ